MRLCAGSGPCCNVERAAEQTTAFVDSGSTRASNCDLDRACRLFFQLLIRQICAPNRPLDMGCRPVPSLTVQTGYTAATVRLGFGGSAGRLCGHEPGSAHRSRALRAFAASARTNQELASCQTRLAARAAHLLARCACDSGRRLDRLCYRGTLMVTTSVARTRRCVRASSSRRARARFVGPRPAPRNRRRRSP